MARESVSLNVIEDVLAQKRIAMVGVSRRPKDFSAMLFDELCRHGYEVLPVNPNLGEFKGRSCYPRVQEIQPVPDVALLMTSPEVTTAVVRDCAEAGIKRVWMYRAGGAGAVSAEALEFCRAHGIEVVPGECPFMFLAPVHGVHRFHRMIAKMLGHYPRRAAESLRA
jgi:uncharacterized protein